MPKSTKRSETRRAAKIAKAHATELPKAEAKVAPSRRSPGYKAPKRGFARRYPFLLTIILLGVIVGIGSGFYALYTNHLWLFAPHVQPPDTMNHVIVVAVPSAANACTASDVLKQITDTAPAPSKTVFDRTTHKYSQAPAMSIDTSKLYCAGINTNRGLIVVELDPQIAPNTVNNFVFLAQHHFYDGLTFHRVLPKVIIQGGDPKGNGTGGPGYQFNDEPVQGDYTAGTVAMANSGPNTNGSQFFINLTDNTKRFQKNYNLFGHVVQGLNIAQKIQGPGDSTSH